MGVLLGALQLHGGAQRAAAAPQGSGARLGPLAAAEVPPGTVTALPQLQEHKIDQGVRFCSGLRAEKSDGDAIYHVVLWYNYCENGWKKQANKQKRRKKCTF